jgi:hypothetical protein
MIVDKVWKLTNTVRVGLDPRSSHAQRQSTFPDNVCSYCPPCHGVSHYENLTTFLFFYKFFFVSLVQKWWRVMKKQIRERVGKTKGAGRSRMRHCDRRRVITEYPTRSLVLSFMNSYMRSLSEDDPIKQTWLDTPTSSYSFPSRHPHLFLLLP